MPLPPLCPLNNAPGCRKQECHLYHIDWRNGEENCSIGYRYTHRQGKHSEPVEDTYVRNVRLRKEKRSAEKARKAEESVEAPVPDAIREVQPEEEDGKEAAPGRAAPAESQEQNTEVSEAGEDKKKKSRIDRIMKGLPEDYEEEFWSDGGRKS